jgi:hypothetical protein
LSNDAVGSTVTLVGALFTSTLTVLDTGENWLVFAGVKVTLSKCVPAVGAVAGIVNANVPGTGVLFDIADPPVSADEASVCPYVIALAVGHVMVGVAMFTCTLTRPVAGR